MSDHIPLLSEKPFNEYTPEEYKLYVKSLFFKKPGRKTPTIKLKKKKPPYSWKITPKGKIAVMIRREPKWLSREEIAQISQESGIEERLVWLQTVSRKKNPIRLSTQSEMDLISLDTNPLPW